MKVHSLIHASGILVLFYVLHALYIDILATSYFFLTIKLEWVVYFFRGAPTGAGGSEGAHG